MTSSVQILCGCTVFQASLSRLFYSLQEALLDKIQVGDGQFSEKLVATR